MDARSCHLATICLLLQLLTACSTKHIAVEPDVLKDVTPETRVTVVHYSPEPFAIWRGEQTGRGSALGMFGLVGGLIEAGMQSADAKEAGAKFISDSQLTDPIAQVERRFLTAWEPEARVKPRGQSQLFSDDGVKTLEKKFGEGYVIDFRTTDWGIVPTSRKLFSTDPRTYRTTYMARARFVRLKDKTVVWEGACDDNQEDANTSPLSLADIDGSDKGVTIKAAMSAHAVRCADSLWRQFFGREVVPELPLQSVPENAAP
jgi:hypothetical protein